MACFLRLVVKKSCGGARRGRSCLACPWRSNRGEMAPPFRDRLRSEKRCSRDRTRRCRPFDQEPEGGLGRRRGRGIVELRSDRRGKRLADHPAARTADAAAAIAATMRKTARSTPSDAELNDTWNAALRGDREAFRAAVTPPLGELLRAARHEVRYRVALGDFEPNDPTAEELVGEVLIRAWPERHN